jgi:hypothetical protein
LADEGGVQSLHLKSQVEVEKRRKQGEGERGLQELTIIVEIDSHSGTSSIPSSSLKETPCIIFAIVVPVATEPERRPVVVQHGHQSATASNDDERVTNACEVDR